MYRVGIYNPYIPVNTRSGIPARIGVLAMIHAHSNHVFFAVLYVRCCIVHERDIPVGAFPERMPVKEYLAPVIDSFEIEVHLLSLFIGRNIHCFAIPTYTAGEVSGATGKRGTQLP